MTTEREEREKYILELLAKGGTLSVATLAEDLKVSGVTVRAALKSLEERGLLARTWGGARANPVGERDGADIVNDEFNRIAAAAAELVLDGDRIMIEGGTTAALIVRHLIGRQGVEIVTNSALAFNYGRLIPDLRIVLTGGLFNRASDSFAGTVAWKAIRGFKARIAFVGTEGFTIERGLTTAFGGGAEVIAAMAAQSDETWLVADSSKYGRMETLSVLGLDRLSGIITDSGLRSSAEDALSEIVPTVRVV